MTKDSAYIIKLEKEIRDLKEQNASQLSMYEMTTLYLKQVQDELKESQQKLSETNKHLLDSINYARYIQNAFMVSETILRRYLPESFVLHLPKDIVSGDFVWLRDTGTSLCLAVGDCTGHGVPGAMLSVFVISMLNQITSGTNEFLPAEVLTALDEKMQVYLSQYSTETKSSAEIALIKYHKSNGQLIFCGAKRSLLHVSGGKPKLVKGNRFVLGETFRRKDLPTNQELNPTAGDNIYMFSDGFPDQFGGPKNSRYSSRRLMQFLTNVSDKPAQVQGIEAIKEFENWRGAQEQIDDVVLVGIKF